MKKHTYLLSVYLILYSIIANNCVFAQVSAEECKELNKALSKKSLEWRNANLNAEIKKKELEFAMNLQRVADAEKSKIVLNPTDLEDLALKVGLETNTRIIDMTYEQRKKYQTDIYNEMYTRYELVSTSSSGDLVEKALNLREEFSKMLKDMEAVKCEVVSSLETGNIPKSMNECEEGVCGTWTLKDRRFHATWNNGAKAELIIEQFDEKGVRIVRTDTEESVSKNFRATYTGKISGNKIIDGKVTWSQDGRTWSGTWTASW